MRMFPAPRRLSVRRRHALVRIWPNGPFRALAMCAAALLAFAGCGRRETTVLAGIRTGTLHFGNDAEPGNLDPQTFTLFAEWSILTSLFEGLVNLSSDGETILPGVAERWEISPDGRRYVFHLRRNARWSNGDPITTKDFVESWRRVLDPALGASNVEYAFPVVGAREYVMKQSTDFNSVGVHAVDDHTLEFKLAYRAPYFLTVLTNATNLGMPVHLPSIDRLGARNRRDGKWTLPGNLVGNGPFLLKEWRPNQVVVVARNPHYWDGARMRLNEVRFRPSEDDGSEERAFRTGQLHTTARVPPTKLDAYRAAPNGVLRQTPLLSTQFISFNCTRAPFSDPRVRRAFFLATDRQVAMDSAYRGRAQVARSFVRAGTGEFEPPPLTLHDPREAKRLLADAGFPGGQGFPAREFRVAAGRTDVIALAETLQQMWKQALGVNISIIQMETKSLIASLHAHDFDLSFSGYYYGIDDPSDMLARAEKDRPGNFAAWHHPDYEEAARAVLAAPTDAARLALFARMETILAEQAPYLPLFHADRTRLVHPSVRGLRENKFDQVDWRDVWLEAPAGR